MMLARSDRFGLVRLGIDAHTLGISMFAQLLRDCGYCVAIADDAVCAAASAPAAARSQQVLRHWIAAARITQLGISYRLDPRDGADLFGRLRHHLGRWHLLAEHGGPIKGLTFAGLPETCRLIEAEHGDRVGVFLGDETAGEILRKVGVPDTLIPAELSIEVRYDDARLAFGRRLLAREAHRSVAPVDRSGYPEYGTARDSLVARLRHSVAHRLPPLIRAHIGPYLADRAAANRLFLDWVRRLAASGHLDILSIGSSQLSQSHFGQDWRDRPNGGGVPVNSRAELADIREAAGAMLVRTYSATANIPFMASVYEQTLNMAWHALSLWWFNRMDGRGPLPVYQTLVQHLDAIRIIAATGKPFEANVSHHFAFRGGDDISYILSVYLAARAAKKLGIGCFVLQNMLNTPKGTWGIADLAKSRAMLALVGGLADETFTVVLQPRAGLDFFSHDVEKAKAQLAAVTALMDDIAPHNPLSPGVIHVVGYSEASHLADVEVVNESIQISHAALREYRRLRAAGRVEEMARNPDLEAATAELIAGVRTLIASIEATIPEPYGAQGLYRIFAAGYLAAPYIQECRDEFRHAARWRTRVVRGSVRVVDEAGTPIPPARRALAAQAVARAPAIDGLGG